jgi:hypothetical protein
MLRVSDLSSIRFLECSETMFENVREHPFWNVREGSGIFQNVPFRLFRNVRECSRIFFGECSRMFENVRECSFRAIPIFGKRCVLGQVSTLAHTFEAKSIRSTR